MISGYDSNYRHRILDGVLKRYKQMESDVSNGVKAWFRSRDQINKDKLIKGGNSSATWHLKQNIKQTLNVPITPGGKLVSKM